MENTGFKFLGIGPDKGGVNSAEDWNKAQEMLKAEGFSNDTIQRGLTENSARSYLASKGTWYNDPTSLATAVRDQIGINKEIDAAKKSGDPTKADSVLRREMLKSTMADIEGLKKSLASPTEIRPTVEFANAMFDNLRARQNNQQLHNKVDLQKLVENDPDMSPRNVLPPKVGGSYVDPGVTLDDVQRSNSTPVGKEALQYALAPSAPLTLENKRQALDYISGVAKGRGANSDAIHKIRTMEEGDPINSMVDLAARSGAQFGNRATHAIQNREALLRGLGVNPVK
jgi:hypothetical protein